MSFSDDQNDSRVFLRASELEEDSKTGFSLLDVLLKYGKTHFRLRICCYASAGNAYITSELSKESDYSVYEMSLLDNDEYDEENGD